MKKLILIIASLTAATLYATPKIHLSKTSAFLKEAGFSGISYESAEATLTSIHFQNIALDPEKISQIKSLTITLSPWALFNRKIKSVTIDSPDIIASLDDNNQLIIDNFSDTNLLQSTSPASPRSIAIKNAELTILTDNWAAITLSFNLNASKKEDTDAYSFQANFDSRQKNLSLSGKASGTSTLHQLRADLDIQTGKFALPEHNIRMTRINGTANIALTPEQPPEILASIEAGGLKAGPTSWHNIAASLQSQNEKQNVTLTANSLGIDGLTLNITHHNNSTIAHIDSPSEETTAEYLNTINISKEELELYTIETLQTEIEFQHGHINAP